MQLDSMYVSAAPINVQSNWSCILQTKCSIMVCQGKGKVMKRIRKINAFIKIEWIYIMHVSLAAEEYNVSQGRIYMNFPHDAAV